MPSFILIILLISFLASVSMAANTMSPSLSQPPSRAEPSGTIISRASDEEKEYVVWPKNGADEDALSKTENHIKAVTGSTSVFSYRNVNNELVIWLTMLTTSQFNEIQKDNGVELIQENIIVVKNQLVPSPSPSAVAQLPDLVPNKAKRAIEYTTQLKAASELVMVSQPSTIPNLGFLENYVYETHAGKDRYIYHVERGISASKQDEFPHDQVEFLPTPLTTQKGLRKDTDDSPGDDSSHSTCTASKAAGQRYGSAKKSTLVVVKMAEFNIAEISEVFDFVWQDIKKRNRQKKSVVTVSWVSASPQDPNNLDKAFQKQRDGIATLLQNDVPVVVSAGNEAAGFDDKGKRRENVDTAPAVFAGDDFPLIVVGATNFEGRRAFFSQGGDKVKILAPGVDIECQDKEKDEPQTCSGTSLAAPLVAGVLANFLAYDTVPFDMSDGHVAANAKAYLANVANWSRFPKVPVIWNGVTEADNPRPLPPGASATVSTETKSPAPTSSAPVSTETKPPAPTASAPVSSEKLACHGISGNAWVVNRDTAIQNIADFCSQSLRSVKYNEGTANELILTVDYPTDLSKTPKDAPDCHNRLSNIVIDGCDGNDGVNNPHNYKYGGTYTASDGWVYMMEPKAIHIDDDDCDVSSRFWYDYFEVRGKNFPDAKLGIDGSGLLAQIRGCSAVTDWGFELTPHDVKYEWYAYGTVIIGKRACVGRAVESAGGSTTGHCNGLG